jgi:septal ring factor EnvC (AmiA/AmiB activator)
MSTHSYSFAEAMKVVNCSESTLRRKLQNEGMKIGATKGKKGWSIPVTVLEALGVVDTVTPDGTSQMTPTDTSQVNDMKVRIATLEERCKGQDRLLSALREQLSDKDRSIRLLEAKPTENDDSNIEKRVRKSSDDETPAESREHGGFWKRIFGK